MAKLPAPEDFGFSPPRPSRGITEISPVREEADLATGKVISDLGAMVRQEADKLDETVALDALNQLQNKQLELTYGNDGFTKLQGKGVIDRKIISTYPTQLQAEADRLLGGIGSPAARQKAQQRADGLLRGFKANVYQHAAKETETYAVQTDNAQFATSQNMAAQGDLAGALAHSAPALARAIERNGLEGDAAAEFARKSMGSIYGTAIETLAKTSPSQAAALFEESKGLLTSQQVTHLGALVKTKSDYAGGLSLSQEAYDKGLKGRAAVEYIQSKSNGNKELAQAGVVDFEHKAGLDKVAEQELAGAAEDVFIKNGMTARAATLAAQTPEFSKLSIAEQSKRKEHWVLAARGTLAFGQHQQDRAEAKRLENPEILLQYQTLLDNPQALARYTDGQIISMRPDFGAAAVQRLVAFKHQNDSEAKRFEIQNTYVEGMMPEDIIKPKTPAATLKRDQFKVIVKDELMDWKIANPGVIPDKDTQVRILEKAKATLGTGARFFGTEVKAYELKPIPQDFASAQNARARQLLKRDLTRDELTAAWARAPGSQI